MDGAANFKMLTRNSIWAYLGNSHSALDVDAFLASNYSTSQGFAILKEETLIDFIT